MTMTAKPSEVSTVVGFIGANAGTAGTFTSDAISLDSGTGRRFVADINMGTIGSSGTVDAMFRWCATSGGGYADMTETSMTQNTTGSKVDTIEAAVEQIMAKYPLAKYIKLQVVTAVAATPFAATVRSWDAAHHPVAAGTDQGTVKSWF